jgi:hypothetical protein
MTVRIRKRASAGSREPKTLQGNLQTCLRNVFRLSGRKQSCNVRGLERCPSSSAQAASAPGSARSGLTNTVYCGGWEVGRIYQTRGGPDSLRWVWSQFQKSWSAWKAWAKLDEVPNPA